MKSKMIMLGVGVSIVFSFLLSVILGKSEANELKVYTYQVGIYNEKQNALDMINTLSNYSIDGLSYLKNNQTYVIACLTLDYEEYQNIVNLLNEAGIKGIEKVYQLDSKYKDDIDSKQYSLTLEAISSYDS